MIAINKRRNRWFMIWTAIILLGASCHAGEAGPPERVRPQKSQSSPVDIKPAQTPSAKAKSAPKTHPEKPTNNAPEILTYDLWANLPLAHLVHRGVIIDAAREGFVKYIRDVDRRWRLDGAEDNRKVAYPPGRQARVWIPVGPQLAKESLVVEVLFKPIRQRRFEIFVNERKVGTLPTKIGWNQVRFPIPKGLLKEGLATVRLYFGRSWSHAGMRTCAAIRYLGIVEAKAPALPIEESKLAQTLERARPQQLVLPKDAGLDYYITPITGLRLVGRVVEGKVEVLTQLDGQSPQSQARGKTLDLSLDSLAGRAVRLMIRGRDGRAILSGARIVRSDEQQQNPPAVPSLRTQRPQYVVFWLIDALRADNAVT